MFKSYGFFISLAMVSISQAQEYPKSLEGIHTTFVSSKWCGNMAVSTLLGNQSKQGQCIYLLETPATGVDWCGPFHLNAYFLEKNAGLGFDCAATHVHSNATGLDGLDEYVLILDKQGHYIQTFPSTGQIVLK